MEFSYPAIFTRQRSSADAPLFATFVAPVGEVLQWAQVERISTEGSGTQRLRNEAKVRAMRRFLELESANTVPTAIIVALAVPNLGEPELGVCANLTVHSSEGQDQPGRVIDGQHRLYGMSAVSADLPVNVVALVNPSDQEIAFQFVVINNKATKVSTDHLRLLALNISDAQLARRLQSARISFGRHATLVGVVDGNEDSPFYHSVIWPVEEEEGDRQHLVLPASIETALAVVSLRRLPDLGDDDALLEFFFALWRAAKKAWPSQWAPESRLLSKVGVVALTTFVVDDLIPLSDRGLIDLSDPEAVETEVSGQILANVDLAFWTTEWIAKGLDTSAGRQMVVDSLIQTRRNKARGIAWNADVPIVPPTTDES